MKNLFIATIVLLTACSGMKPTADENRSNTPDLIQFKVKNNSLLTHKYAIIGYNPGETGNWTTIIVLAPGASRKYSCPIGTKIYRADNKQVDIVMGGGNLRAEEPFITVTAAIAGKSFPLQ
jgi:hypothetical protein